MESEENQKPETIFGLENVKIVLADINPVLCEEWRVQFSEEISLGTVEVYCGNIFDCQNPPVSARGSACRISEINQVNGATAMISPGNSFGFMDGGIEMAYLHVFGKDLEKQVQNEILEKFYGEMPVGFALIVETGNSAIQFLVSAPTMRVPLDARSTVAAYSSFRAALLVIRDHNYEKALFQNLILSEGENGEKNEKKIIARILCPGLGTGVGRMPPDRCAYQMKEAYLAVVNGVVSEMDSPSEAAPTRAIVPNIEGIHVISDSPIPPLRKSREKSPSNTSQRVDLTKVYEDKTSNWAERKGALVGRTPRILSAGESSITSSLMSEDVLPMQQTGFNNVGDAVKQHYWMRKYCREHE